MTFRCPNGQYYFERTPLSQNIEYHVSRLECALHISSVSPHALAAGGDTLDLVVGPSKRLGSNASTPTFQP